MLENQNSYDFILNNENQPKKKRLLGFFPSPQNKAQRILFVATGGTVLLLLSIIVFGLLFAGDGGEELNMRLAQRHAEIIRVANIGVEKARGQDTRNLAITTKLSLQSSQARLHNLIGDRVDNRQIAAGRDAATDTALGAAEQNNRFDEAFVTKLTLHLREYQAQLQTALVDVPQSESKEVYHKILTQVSALLPESPEE